MICLVDFIQNDLFETRNYLNLYFSNISLLEFLKEDLPYLIIGAVLFIVNYLILFFFKDLYITYLRKEDRAYFYKYVNLKPHIKPIILFSFLVSLLWGVSVLISFYKIISYGSMSFVFLYSIYNLKYYVWDKNEFDYFEDLIVVYRFYKSKNCKKNKND
jgi:hypothetical protein